MTPRTTRFIAALLLCLHGWLSTPVASFVFASVAAWNGEHEVRFQFGAAGPRVVLHHLPQKLTIRVEDHTSPLGRALSTLCQVNSHGDHIFEQPATTTSITATYRPLTTDEFAKHATSIMLVPDLEGIPHVSVTARVAALRLLEMERSARPMCGLGTMVLLI